MLIKVLNTIKKYNMISKGDSVTIALSGGADSVALLLVLLKLQKELEIELNACHINHNLRGEEAKRDENFCISLCNSLGINLVVESVDVLNYCKANKLSTETAARDLRYMALNRIAKGKIATAHTLSDSFETSVFNFVRGSGLKGICGIAPVRDNIVRPLIYITRQEIESFLHENNQSYVNDSTNFENIYNRNKIRNIVIPEFQKINPSLFSTFKNNVNIIEDENAFLDITACAEMNKIKNDDGSLSADKLASLHNAVIRRIIMLFISSYDIKYDYKKVELILSMLETGGSLELTDNFFAAIKQNKLYIEEKTFPNDDKKTISLKCDDTSFYPFMGKLIQITPVKDEEKKFFVNSTKKAFKNYVDCDKINPNIILRTKKPGDQIKLAGRNVTKSLKKLFNEAKLLPQIRNNTIIFQNQDDIIFVEGFGCSEKVKITDNTKNAVEIKIEKQ